MHSDFSPPTVPTTTASAGPAGRLLAVLAVAAAALFTVQVFSDNKADVDLWGNVGFVRHWPTSPDFAYENPHTYADRGARWINHEWLAQYLFWRVRAAAGNAGLLALKTLIGLGVAALLAGAIRGQTRSGALAWLYYGLTISTMSYGYATRPHHYTYLFTALFLHLLRRYGVRPWLHLAVLPLLAVPWANLHGAFFVGALIMLAHGAGFAAAAPGGRLRVLALSAAGAALFVAASMANPYGPRLWSFIFTSGARARTYLSEWAPFHPLRDTGTHIDFVVLAALTLPAVVRHARREPAWTGLYALGLAAALGMRRNIPLFALAAAFVAPGCLDAAVGGAVRRLAARVPRALLCAGLAAFLPLSAWTWATFNKTDPLDIELPADTYPVEAVAFARLNRVEGNAIVFFDWAEYAIWHLYPRWHVFLDGRFLSAYRARTIDDYLNFLYARPGRDRALEAYDTDIALLHAGNPAAAALAARPGWRLAFARGPALLFLREDRHGRVLADVAAGTAVQPDTRPPYRFP